MKINRIFSINNKILYISIAIILLLFAYGFITTIFFHKELEHQYAKNKGMSLVLGDIDAQLNQKNPRNLFFNFYTKALYMWCGYYRDYYHVANCINAEYVKTNSVFNVTLNNKIKKLIVALLETDFRFEQIPVEAKGNKLSIALGVSQLDRQVFTIARNKDNNWYFTEDNFKNPKTIEKYNAFKIQDKMFGNTTIRDLSLPILAYLNFIIGYERKAGLNINDALQVMETDWIPKAIRSEYSRFLAFTLFKVLETYNISLSAIPGRTDADNNVVVLSVFPQLDASLYLQKKTIGQTSKYKWYFTERVLENALSIFRFKPMKLAEEDPLWFRASHFIFYNIPFMQYQIYGVTAGLVFLIFINIIYLIVGTRLLRFIISRLMHMVKHHNKSYIVYSSRFSSSFALVIVFLGSKVIFSQFYMTLLYKNVFFVLHYVFAIVFGVIFIWWVCECINTICSIIIFQLQKDRVQKFRISFIINIINKILNILAIIIVSGLLMQKLGINMINFLTALGIGGLSVAFAGKDTIENLFGSIMIAFEKPFKIGDWIVINDIEGYVEHIGIRSTRIRTFENSYMTVPNVKFITSNVNNMEARNFRRYKTFLDVVEHTPREKLEKYLKKIDELIINNPKINNKDYFIKVNELGEFSIKILIYVYFIAKNWREELNEREKFILDLVYLAEKMDIQLAYPTQTLMLSNSNDNKSKSDFDKTVKDLNRETRKKYKSKLKDRT